MQHISHTKWLPVLNHKDMWTIYVCNPLEISSVSMMWCLLVMDECQSRARVPDPQIGFFGVLRLDISRWAHLRAWLFEKGLLWSEGYKFLELGFLEGPGPEPRPKPGLEHGPGLWLARFVFFGLDSSLVSILIDSFVWDFFRK